MQDQNEFAHPNDNMTDTTSPQPMDFTDILDRIYTIYRDHFGLLLAIAAVYLVSNYSIDLVSIYFIRSDMPSTIIVGSLFSVIATIVSFFVTAGLTYASAQVYLRRAITPQAAFQQAARRFWSYLGGSILWLLGSVGLFITVLGIPFAIYFSIRWSLYSLPILLEDTRAWNSLGRSTELVKGSWSRVLGITITVYLISGMITVILYISIEFVLTLAGVIEIGDATGLLDSLLRLIYPAPDQGGWFSYAILRFVALCIATLTMPIAIIGFTLLYFDLRIRKEGFDSERQVKDEELTAISF